MCTTVQNPNKLQLIQNDACRTILCVPKETSVAQMHKEFAIPTLEQRWQYHLATECYKSVTIPDSDLNFMFNLVSNNRNRSIRLATNMGMTEPRLNTTQGHKAFRYRGSICWNGLEQDFKISENLTIFKSKMLKDLLRDVNHPG